MRYPGKEVAPPRRALITGVSGFIGRHLVHFLASQGWQVFGFDQQKAFDGKDVYVGNLRDRSVFVNVLKECRPDVIFHLAGLIKSSEPEALYNVNLLGTVALFESLLELGQRPEVMIASTSAVYGSGFEGKPITEKFHTRPVTHYGVSKLAQEIAALRYCDAFGLSVLVVRMFNLLGPGQSPDLACSAFARQIALAEVRGDTEILTGNLSARRDFVDVRDAVRAFELLIRNGKSGQVYNICSGQAVLVRDCLDEMLSMSPYQLKVRLDAERLQQNDVPVQIGDGQKLNQITGWIPEISLRQSLADLLTYWRQRVKADSARSAS